jgi:cyclopropane fatty-acyl-phospholipid synthase-like methyltransferase
MVSDGYDRLGSAFSAWVAENPPEVRSWFLGEVLTRLGAGSDVLELGCGPGTAATALSAGRRYVGVDLSAVQLSFARRRAPRAAFVRGDLTRIAFRPSSFDGVVAFYVFNHVPRDRLAPTFERVGGWLRPGGWLMLSLGASDTDDAIEPDWLGVSMFFSGFPPAANERLLREAGFQLEVSEILEEEESRHGLVAFHWVIARKQGPR